MNFVYLYLFIFKLKKQCGAKCFLEKKGTEPEALVGQHFNKRKNYAFLSTAFAGFISFQASSKRPSNAEAKNGVFTQIPTS